jgi:hypothetical protein
LAGLIICTARPMQRAEDGGELQFLGLTT